MPVDNNIGLILGSVDTLTGRMLNLKLEYLVKNDWNMRRTIENI